MSDWSEIYAPPDHAGRFSPSKEEASDEVKRWAESRQAVDLSGAPDTVGCFIRSWTESARLGAEAELAELPDASGSEAAREIRKRPPRAKQKNGRSAVTAGSPHLYFLLRAAAGDFVFEEVSPAFETSTGLTSALVLGRALHDVLPKAVAANIVGRCRQCLSGAAPILSMPMMMPLPVGLTPWELSLTQRFDESGAVMGVCGTAREVGRGLEIQVDGGEAGRLPNIRFTALPNGLIERIHPSLLSIAGLPLDFPSEAVIPIVRPEDLAPLAGGETTYERDVKLCGPGGRYRWFRVRAELIDGLAGRRWYGLAIDIDAEKGRALDLLKSAQLRAGVAAGFGDCSVTVDQAWRIMAMTSRSAACIGERQDQLIGIDCRDRLPIPKALIEAFENSLSAQALQVKLPAPDRPDRWIEFQIHPFAGGARILFWDVAEPRRGGAAVLPVAAWSHHMAHTAIPEMALLDTDGVIVSVNAAWRQLVKEEHIGGATQGVGMSYVELCNAAIPDLDSHALSEGINEVVLGHRADYAQPYVIARSSGLRWRQLRIIPFGVEPSLQLVAVHENITDVDQARAALRNTSEQMLSALAHERERIAFELHDSTSQHLAALGLGLIRLRRLVGDGAGDLITDMTKSVQETVREIRVLSYLMKPLGLGPDGLCPAARLFVSGFGARTGLEVEFRTRGSFRAIADAVQGAAFRILQEALSNIYKHAHASRVAVDLTRYGGALIVRIADDGHGIPLSGSGHLTVPPGVGLASMEARVTQLGGTLTISRGAVGTIVEARIPLGEQDA